MKKQTKSYIYAGFAVLAWSTVASAFKLTLGEVNYMQMVFYASLFSVLALTAILLIQGKTGSLVRQSPKTILTSALLGLLNPFLYYVVLFRAYSLLPAQEAQPLNFTWPIVLALLSAPLLGQKLKARSVIALLVSFAGVIVISTRGDLFGLKFVSVEGTVLAVGSSLVWALYWIYNVKDRRDTIVKLFYYFVFGSVYTLIAMFIVGLTFKVSLPGLIGCAYIGFFEMGITFVLWSRALSLSDESAKVANIAYLSPFISLIFIHYLVGETILPSSIIGLILIIAGILIQNILRKKQ